MSLDPDLSVELFVERVEGLFEVDQLSGVLLVLCGEECPHLCWGETFLDLALEEDVLGSPDVLLGLADGETALVMRVVGGIFCVERLNWVEVLSLLLVSHLLIDMLGIGLALDLGNSVQEQVWWLVPQLEILLPDIDPLGLLLDLLLPIPDQPLPDR